MGSRTLQRLCYTYQLEQTNLIKVPKIDHFVSFSQNELLPLFCKKPLVLFRIQ